MVVSDRPPGIVPPVVQICQTQPTFLGRKREANGRFETSRARRGGELVSDQVFYKSFSNVNSHINTSTYEYYDA